MIIINTTDNTKVDVTLHLWRGGWNAGFEPDALQDLASDDLNPRPHDDDGYPMMSADDFHAFIDWWTDEIARSNSGRDGDGLQGLTAEEIARGDEWMLTVD